MAQCDKQAIQISDRCNDEHQETLASQLKKKTVLVGKHCYACFLSTNMRHMHKKVLSLTLYHHLKSSELLLFLGACLDKPCFDF